MPASTVLKTSALQEVLKLRNLSPPILFIFLKIVWLFQMLYISIYILGSVCQLLQKSAGILIAIILNLWINWMRFPIVTILSHPIHEHELYLHLFSDS